MKLPAAEEKNAPSWVLEGLKASIPNCLGFIPIGLAFGVLAQKAGLSPLQIGLMSTIVFAGSSQFIAISMLSQGAAAISIIATTFIVNLRHFLMSSALSIHLGKVKKSTLSLYAYGVTDESFAINLPKFRDGKWDVKRAIVLNQAANLTWILSTVVGGIGGEFIPKGAFGIDYALPAMFICLLVYQLRGNKYIVTAIISGASAVILSLLIPGNSYVVLASIIAATTGVMFRRVIKREVRNV
jgi:4-azaleucine resistance transporter AzlC